MRLFLAINLPLATRRAIRAITEPMRDAAHDVVWVTEERLHLTLKFFGEQDEASIDSLRTRLTGVAAASVPLELEVGGLGAFPNLRAPRVVWMGVGHDPKLELLHHDIESACAALGFEVDGRAFRPHLTLGRVRDRLAPPTARALADAARRIEFAQTVDARTLDLMASKLSSTGPRYSVLAAMPFGERS